MTLEQCWIIFIKRWPIILICFLVVGLGTFAGSKLMKPLYQSTALVQVVFHSTNNNQSDYNNLLAGDQLVQTDATLATSDQVLQAVAHDYHMTLNQLAGEVSSTTKLNTQLFEIDVVDQSPTRAANIANDVAKTLITQQSVATKIDNSTAQSQIQQNINSTIAKLQVKGLNQGQIALLQTQLSGWQTALDQLELTQAQNGNPLHLTQPAQSSEIPVRPNLLLNTGVGLLVGLLMGILLALLIERLDTRVRTPEEITQLIGWPVLATIWRITSSSQEEVINPTGSNVNVEPFRILRTNIGFASLDKPLHSMVITSAQPRDGKSAIAANVAIFMARAGKSTLLIDADLRRPTQHTLFQLSPDKFGLSNAVLAFNSLGTSRTPSYNQYDMNAAILQSGRTTTQLSLEPFVHSVGIPNLWVMPSGPLPPNPSELFESKAMQRFLEVIENCGIEVVIFDTPPLLGLSDASILAAKVDSALVVIDTTRATKGKLRQTRAVLTQTGVHVLGCVANKLQHKRNDSSYYYYNYGYSYTDDQSKGEKSTRNGHIPLGPDAPMPKASSSEQQLLSN
jgi:Mrp family chromosome partitioning ATPase